MLLHCVKSRKNSWLVSQVFLHRAHSVSQWDTLNETLMKVDDRNQWWSFHTLFIHLCTAQLCHIQVVKNVNCLFITFIHKKKKTRLSCDFAPTATECLTAWPLFLVIPHLSLSVVFNPPLGAWAHESEETPITQICSKQVNTSPRK